MNKPISRNRILREIIHILNRIPHILFGSEYFYEKKDK